MTPPADHRSTLRALVEAGEKATPGEWHETHGEIECDQCGEQAYLCDVTSHAEDDTPYLSLAMQFVGLESLARPNADFVCAAANARPALAAIERKVWLDVETVRTLISAASNFDRRLADDAPALAAAEAEVRRVEGR
jgi:hypothetical protein